MRCQKSKCGVKDMSAGAVSMAVSEQVSEQAGELVWPIEQVEKYVRELPNEPLITIFNLIVDS